MLETPVAFFVFNRPDTARRVFAEIAKARPKKLLVVADGPRPDRPGEAERCAEVRSIIDQVDWDCEVLKNYADHNMGCKYRVSSGLDWVFEQYEDAIILEDDCLPSQTFFQFCAELLDKYRYEEKIMSISGNNFQFGKIRGGGSYYFSIYAHIWGWATWRRAWSKYDIQMLKWNELRDTDWLKLILKKNDAVEYWHETYEACFKQTVDTWGLPWMFNCWCNDGLTILPNVNLVSNIGFGVDAVHTHTDIYGVANMETENILFPIIHPTGIIRNLVADRYTFQRIFAREKYRPPIWKQIAKRILKAVQS